MDEIVDKLREQLDWRTSDGRPQVIITLPREQAEAVCAALSARAGSKPEVGDD